VADTLGWGSPHGVGQRASTQHPLISCTSAVHAVQRQQLHPHTGTWVTGGEFHVRPMCVYAACGSSKLDLPTKLLQFDSHMKRGDTQSRLRVNELHCGPCSAAPTPVVHSNPTTVRGRAINGCTARPAPNRPADWYCKRAVVAPTHSPVHCTTGHQVAHLNGHHFLLSTEA
jgi:hypothetical protein